MVAVAGGRRATIPEKASRAPRNCWTERPSFGTLSVVAGARFASSASAGANVAAYSLIGASKGTFAAQLEIQGGGQLEEHFDLDQEFDIVELEPRGAASPDGLVIVVNNNGSGGSGSGSLTSGSGGSGGSGGGIPFSA